MGVLAEFDDVASVWSICGVRIGNFEIIDGYGAVP